MSDLMIDIENMLREGYSEADVALVLDIPGDWVTHVAMTVNGEESNV